MTHYLPKHVLITIFSFIPSKIQLLFVCKRFKTLYQETLLKYPLLPTRIDIDYSVKYISHKSEFGKTVPDLKEERLTFQFLIEEYYHDPLINSAECFYNIVSHALSLNETMVDPRSMKPRSAIINSEAHNLISRLHDSFPCKNCPGHERWPQQKFYRTSFFAPTVEFMHCPLPVFKTNNICIHVNQEYGAVEESFNINMNYISKNLETS